MMRIHLILTASAILTACGRAPASKPSSNDRSPGGPIAYNQELVIQGGEGSLAQTVAGRMKALNYPAEARINCSEALGIARCVVKDASKSTPVPGQAGLNGTGLAIGLFVNESSGTVFWRTLSPLGKIELVSPQRPNGQRRLTYSAGTETVKCLYVPGEPSGLWPEHVMCSYAGTAQSTP